MFIGCQSTTRFVTDDISKKNNFITKKDTSVNDISNNITTPPPDYNSIAKIIEPKQLSNKYNHKIVSIAEQWLGSPYLYGGNTKMGVDCSGFVKCVYKEIGINLPRTSAQQYAQLKPTNSPTIGDLVFFKKGNKINHVGIFIGNGKMIHSSSGKGVIIQTILGTSLEHRLAGYRKVK